MIGRKEFTSARDGQIVGFGGGTGEDNVSEIGIQKFGHCFSGNIQGAVGFGAEGVNGARVAEFFGKKRTHGFKNLAGNGCARGIIKINFLRRRHRHNDGIIVIVIANIQYFGNLEFSRKRGGKNAFMRLQISDFVGENFSFAEIFKKRAVWVIAGIVVFVSVVVLFSARVIDRGRNITLPKSFLDARFSAALVSRHIVELTEETNKKIKNINIYDLSGKGFQAMNLVSEARANNGEANREAVQLSNSLEQMAIALADLPPGRVQRKAYEAVAIELSLVSEFIRYTQNLNDFLDKLDKAISLSTDSARKDVYGALTNVNKSAEAINKLNDRFTDKMREFDEAL